VLASGASLWHGCPMRIYVIGSVTAIVVLAVSGCGSGTATECLSSEVGEVCAVSTDGAITFNGRGLEARSNVLISAAEVEGPSSMYEVDQDGILMPEDGALGFMSGFADADFNFTISAIDKAGEVIDGKIVIST
jgi:hypothetical protein